MSFKQEITKRQLGAVLITAGILIIGGVLAYDVLKRHAVGDRLQLFALAIGALLMFLGMALLPLGANPACPK
jgi:hypothetical protein